MFSNLRLNKFTQTVSELPTVPNLSAEEMKARFDACPEELREKYNVLCDALSNQTAASSLGFARTTGVAADTVQAAIENVQNQVVQTSLGQIADGSITDAKLAQDVQQKFNSLASDISGCVQREQEAQAQIQQHTQEIAQKCSIYMGVYVGDGTEYRQVTLGFQPKAVLLMTEEGSMYNSSSRTYCGGLASVEHPLIYAVSNGYAHDLIRISVNGFIVSDAPSDSYTLTNQNGMSYRYLAFA